jgi:hypothetical protein
MCVEQCDVTFRVNHRPRAGAGGERARRSEADDAALGVDFTQQAQRPFTDLLAHGSGDGLGAAASRSVKYS